MVVTTAWSTVLPNLQSTFLSSNSTTYIPLPDEYEVAKVIGCSFILIGAATETAQPKPVCQDQRMSASAACNHFSQLYRWKVQAVMKVHSRINDFSII